MRKINLLGQRFGRLRPIKEAPRDAAGHIKWECLCDCGNTTIVGGGDLRRKHHSTKSCGCLIVERNKELSTTHGKTRSKTWKSWNSMNSRCNNPHVKGYQYWGGRGVSICERWRSFENFLADMGERLPGTSLDRWPNKDGNYEPNNCRWATCKQQARNTTANVLLTYRGATVDLMTLADQTGIPHHRIRSRLSNGHTDEEAITMPHHSRRGQMTAIEENQLLRLQNEGMSTREIAQRTGIPKSTVQANLARLREKATL